jgi:hypothetical protein
VVKANETDSDSHQKRFDGGQGDACSNTGHAKEGTRHPHTCTEKAVTKSRRVNG